MLAEPEPDAHGGAAGGGGDGEARLPDAGIQARIETNLYAPPKARVEPAQQVGQLWRSGALVRMDRAGALPDRCVVCDAEAGGYRLSRKLYSSPLAWRIGAVATPFVVMGLGIVTESPVLALLFWPLVLALMIAHTFVRKKLELEIGMCPRHRRWRTALRVASVACIVGVVASTAFWRIDNALAAVLLLGSLGGMLLVGITQAIVGVQAVSVSKLTGEHAWLARTGKAFRAALPELPG